MPDVTTVSRRCVVLMVLALGVAPEAGAQTLVRLENTGTFAELATDTDLSRASLANIEVDIDALVSGAAVDAIHGNVVVAGGPQLIAETKDFDGLALPLDAAVIEGDATRVASTLYGVLFGFLTNEDGSKQLGKLEDDAHATADYALPILTRRIDAPATSAGTSGDYATADSGPDGGIYVHTIPSSVGGASGHKRTSAGATEDEHEIKATAGTLYSITATNTNAAARYLRCGNATLAVNAPGTTTPIVDLAIPGPAAGGSVTATFPAGFAFSTALTCWMVTGAADTDVVEVAANEVKVFYTFK